MDKKEYIAPELTFLGDVEELTRGESMRGSDDQFWYLPLFTAADPTSG